MSRQSAEPADMEKGLEAPKAPGDPLALEGQHETPSGPQGAGAFGAIGRLTRKFEQRLVEYNVEARGMQRVEPHETHNPRWIDYVQAFVLWVSINLAANNITLGMLAPAVYGLSFTDSALCAVFGSLVGSIPVAYLATWGPISGNRTMVRTNSSAAEAQINTFGRYSPDILWAGGRGN